MSEDKKNKGKKGEAIVSRIASNIMYIDPYFDYRRHTNMNTPDMGVDFLFENRPGFVDNVMIPIANGKEPTASYAQLESSRHKSYKKTEETRIDVKETNYKIGVPTANKFIQDCSKNPLCDRHILMGGKGLTPEAKKIISSHPNTRYVNNEGIKRLDTYFSERRDALEKAENKNCLINKENNESES